MCMIIGLRCWLLRWVIWMDWCVGSLFGDGGEVMVGVIGLCFCFKGYDDGRGECVFF